MGHAEGIYRIFKNGLLANYALFLKDIVMLNTCRLSLSLGILVRRKVISFRLEDLKSRIFSLCHEIVRLCLFSLTGESASICVYSYAMVAYFKTLPLVCLSV